MANERARGLGYKFVTDDKYLVDPFSPTDGISYEGDGSPVSYANSMGGIMSQAPIPGPLKYIPEGGGGGGKPPGPAVDNSQFDYETEAYGIDPSQGLTEEEQEALDNQITGPKLGKLGTLGTIAGMFTAPFSTIGFHHRRNKKIQKELEEKTREAGIQADFDRAMAQGRDFYDTLNDGAGASVSDQSREEAGSGFNDVSESGPFAKGGRVGYFFGGRVNYKTGGRINFRGGGMDMGNESNQTQSANMGGGATGDFSTGEQTMNHNRAMRNAAKQTTPVKNIIDAGSELNYLNNLKNLNLPGIALGFGVNKFRDFIGNKKTKEEEDKLSALPNNNYFADLNAAQIKQLEGPQKMGKEYGNFSDQEILDNITPFGDEETAPATLKDVQTFYGSNGGRAMFKNGGLASIL